jgi:Flp pilus assembly pilin Flp
MLKLATLAQRKIADVKNDLKGVTAMEYGIIAATTVVVVGGVVGGLHGSLTTIWASIGTALTNAIPAA